MSERYDHPTGQLRLRPRSSRRLNLVVVAGTAAVLALLVLNVMVWSNWSGRPAPVGATQSPPASASPVPTESPVAPEPTASPSPASPGQGGGAEPGPAEPEPSEEPAEPESPAEPEEPEATVVVIDPAVVLPSITPTVTDVVPAGCLDSTTASGAIEVSALDLWIPMTVEYRWLRSGEFFGPTQSVEVAGNTTIPVSTQWKSTVTDGWVALEVTSAFGAVSEKVTFPSCLS